MQIDFGGFIATERWVDDPMVMDANVVGQSQAGTFVNIPVYVQRLMWVFPFIALPEYSLFPAIPQALPA